MLLLVGVLPLEGPVERATGEKNHESVERQHVGVSEDVDEVDAPAHVNATAVDQLRVPVGGTRSIRSGWSWRDIIMVF